MFKEDLSNVALAAQRKKNNRCVGINKNIETQKGFTLIEIVVTLVLVGILSAVGGMGIVQAVKGYVAVKQNSEITQKYQNAMSRINREIKEMINIPSSATGTVIPITGTSNCFSATDCVRTIGLDNNTIKIASGSSTSLADGDVLLDNVSSFNITYYKQSTSYTTWAPGNDQDLSGVKVDITVNLPGGGTLGGGAMPFDVSPRNNGNLGGVNPPTPGSTTVDTSSWGCFVATAAYGDSGHPMVQILRDFRDRQLIYWPGGKWFIKQYYKHGPAAADIIRNKPVLMWAVRCLLAPFVAIAFCMMYAPLAIIFVFFTSLIITMAVFSVFRRKLQSTPGFLHQRGSILVGLIVTMVIMAVLAAAMLPMFSSSYMNQVYADQGRKAYYLAESGFAYAALQYREAETDADKEAVLAEMNDETFSLEDSSSFTNTFYPYYFTVTTVGSNMATQVGPDLSNPSGYVPSQFNSLTSGYVRVCTTGSSSSCGDYSYTSTDAVAGKDNTLTFNGINKISGSTAVSGSYVQPLVYSNNGSNTVTEGGSISINATGGNALPVYNGTFTIDPAPSGAMSGLVFRYQKKVGNTLQNITLADPRKVWHDLVVPNTSKIVLNKFLVLSSTGRTPSGFEREVRYNTPVGASSGAWNKPQSLSKNMENFITAADKSMGTHSVSGGSMQVTSVVDPLAVTSGGLLGWAASVIKSFLSALRLIPNPGVWAVTGWDWSNTDTNLAQSFNDTGGALSYDVQVKVDNSAKKYFMNGIGFRLRNNSGTTDSTKDAYGYGVSVIRQRQTRCCSAIFDSDVLCSSWGTTLGLTCLESSGAEELNDGIPDELRPLTSYAGSELIWHNFGALSTARQYARYSDPVVVLWQRNGPATSQGDFKLLAYRVLQPGDGLTYCASGAASCTGSDLRLKPWITLMARVIEGYELSFTSGRVDALNRHFKYGYTIMDSTGAKTARIVGTPVMSTNWGAAGSSSGQGKMLLTNVTGGGFASGDNLLILGGDGSSYGTASAAQAATKTNYIMVYYSDNKTPVAGDTTQINNTRIGNVLYTTETQANWPPDDQTDAAAGLPTATPAGNDYFTLMQWHYITPGTNQVSPYTSWTFGSGWSSTSNYTLNRVTSFGEELIEPLTNTYWDTTGSGWDFRTSPNRLRKRAIGAGTIYPADNLSTDLVNGETYQISVTIDSGTLNKSYTIGTNYSKNYTSTGTITEDFVANSGTWDNLIFTGSSSATAVISSVSVKQHIPPGTTTIPLINPLTAGTTFTVSFTVSGLDTGESLSYTIGGLSATIASNGAYSATHTLPWDAASAGNIVFSSSSDVRHEFAINSISVVPSVLNGTLDTSPDSQGNVASYVPAHGSLDFYQAVIKTGALLSPAGTTYQDFVDAGGDNIALITSSYAGAGTFYDDFAVQLDTKVGVGFLPPIQE